MQLSCSNKSMHSGAGRDLPQQKQKAASSSSTVRQSSNVSLHEDKRSSKKAGKFTKKMLWT